MNLWMMSDCKSKGGVALVHRLVAVVSWQLLGCGGRVCVYVTWLFLVEPMRIQTTIGSAKILAALQRINLGKGS